MDWFIVGLAMSLATAAVIALGLRVQRSKPDRRWPVVAVGLVAGLVAGLAIIGAIWTGDRYPRRRRLVEGASILVASSLMFLVAHSLYGPPFGIGAHIESGTIDRPARGYAITLPDDWRVEDLAGVTELFGEVVEPGYEPELIAVDDAAGAFLLVATLDLGEGMSPGIVAFSVTAEARADPFIEDVRWERVQLAGRPASRIDATLMGSGGQPLPAPMELSIYMVSADERAYQALYFYGPHAPADRWSAIAATLAYTADA